VTIPSFAPDSAGENEPVVNETVTVEAARIPDRDRLLDELREAGIEARAVDEVCLEVPCGDDADGATDELFARAEDAILRIGAPFVPIKHDGTIYIRPPLS
jgi:hypothetical protein